MLPVAEPAARYPVSGDDIDSRYPNLARPEDALIEAVRAWQALRRLLINNSHVDLTTVAVLRGHIGGIVGSR